MRLVTFDDAVGQRVGILIGQENRRSDGAVPRFSAELHELANAVCAELKRIVR